MLRNCLIAFLKAHEEPRYAAYIGQFKKPEIGMFQVMSDIALLEFDVKIDDQNSVMIGDTWHDQRAAQDFGIPFLEAQFIHDDGKS